MAPAAAAIVAATRVSTTDTAYLLTYYRTVKITDSDSFLSSCMSPTDTSARASHVMKSSDITVISCGKNPLSVLFVDSIPPN